MAAQSATRRLKISGLRLNVTDTVPLREVLARRLEIEPDRIHALRTLRRSLDARPRSPLYEYILAADIELEDDACNRLLSRPDVERYCEEPLPPTGPNLHLHQRPIVVGCGPAGLFAALGLAERGCPPLVIERGSRLFARSEAVRAFWDRGELNTESNVVFGEGGAGAFSDGKLTARGASPFKRYVLEKLISCGADEQIACDARPHVGTDRLRVIIPEFVEHLRSRGVEFRFNTRMDDIVIEQGRVRALRAGGEILAAGLLVLAVGHSARDTLRMLAGRGMRLQPKGFAVGLRAEHPQILINRALFRDEHARAAAGAAEYALRHADRESGRGVYSFCMCPGGLVIGCASQPGMLCINGMSYACRSGSRANAALVVTVAPDDFYAGSELDGIVFQEQLEQRAYAAASSPCSAPVQRADDFIRGRISAGLVDADTSFKPGVTSADLTSLLPGFAVEPLRRALRAFDGKIPGFIEQGVLIGVETRTSSPVRMLRDPHTFEAVGIAGLVPVGEGAGYAGGIVSSAVDGLRAVWNPA